MPQPASACKRVGKATRCKQLLLTTPDLPDMVARMTEPQINGWYWRQHYGLVPQQMNRDQMIRFTKALLVIIGADGEISPAEVEALIGWGRALGASEGMVDELRGFDWQHTTLESLLSDFKDGVPARSMLYDAIVIASADGYHPHEQGAVHRAAQVLGVDNSVVRALEALCEAEANIRRARAALFAPEIPGRKFE